MPNFIKTSWLMSLSQLPLSTPNCALLVPSDMPSADSACQADVEPSLGEAMRKMVQ
jgi:hypothetical protein